MSRPAEIGELGRLYTIALQNAGALSQHDIVNLRRENGLMPASMDAIRESMNRFAERTECVEMFSTDTPAQGRRTRKVYHFELDKDCAEALGSEG